MIAYALAKLVGTRPNLRYAEAPATDGNVFVDWMPDQPSLAVAVMNQPGLPQLTKLPHDLPTVQLLVRGEPYQARVAQEVALDLYDQLNCLAHVVLDAGGPDEVYVVGCTAQQSSPVPLGRDELHRPEYSLNFQFRTHQPTTHRPAVG